MVRSITDPAVSEPDPWVVQASTLAGPHPDQTLDLCGPGSSLPERMLPEIGLHREFQSESCQEFRQSGVGVGQLDVTRPQG